MFQDLQLLITSLPLRNFDLLSVGITIAAILILGFVIFINDRKSITNKSFLYLGISSSVWSIINYLSYQANTENTAILLLRLLMFSAIWFAFALFQFLYVFPEKEKIFPWWYKYAIVPWVFVVLILTLTPLVFEKIIGEVKVGQVAAVQTGNGIVIFGILVFILVGGGLSFFIRKMILTKKDEQKQYEIVFFGLIITFLTIISLDFILPAFIQVFTYIPFGAIFIFPFIIFTAYAIYKHNTFNVKNIASATFAFLLCLVTFIEVIFSDNYVLLIFRISVFILVLIISIQFIRNIFNLEQANQRLKELDQLKSEFVSLATHQIRAPLAAIKGYISEIFEGDFGQYPKELDKPLNIVMQSTENLVNIVGDFLNISRIEQGRMVYDFSTFDISKMLEEVGNELKPNIERAKLEFSVNIEPGKYMVSADIGKMRQIISNLIDNSIKYTKQGWIKVGIKNNISDNVLIFIKDTGVGITPETMPKLFQKFSRAKDANQTNVIGTGLGLYVVKTMVEAQHGRVWAESEGSGKGSTFYVELPVVHSN